MNTKKAVGGIGPIAVFVVVLILILLIWLITYLQRECHGNAECPQDAYCGSDFVCHKYPATTQVVKRTDFTAAAFLIGLAIVVAAIILRRKHSPPSDNIEPKVIHPKDHVAQEDKHDEQSHHHHHEPSPAKSALEKFEGHHRKDSQSMEKYGEDAHAHTPKHH